MLVLKKIRILAKMQTDVASLKASNHLTKQALCNACVPVRDELGLTDQQTLSIANGNSNLADIAVVLGKDEANAEMAARSHQGMICCFLQKNCSGCPYSDPDYGKRDCMATMANEAMLSKNYFA